MSENNNTPENSTRPKAIQESIDLRRAVLDGYLNTLSLEEQREAAKHSLTLQEQGGGSDLSPFVVITPIAAHQESPETITHALTQYTKQRPLQDFSVILNINYPTSHDGDPAVGTTIDTVEAFRQLHPDSDIRYFVQSYDQPTIGKIRRDAWNAALHLSMQPRKKHTYVETIGLNQDIDLTLLSPHFMQSVKQFYVQMIMRDWTRGTTDIMPISTRAKHSYDSRFPNISKLVFWTDILNRMSGNGFEAGSVIPFIYYAAQGGIAAENTMHEVNDLLEKVQYHPRILSYTANDAVYSETSPRRYIAHLQHTDTLSVWEEGSFTAHDAYRLGVDAYKDISRDRMLKIIAENATRSVYNNFLYPVTDRSTFALSGEGFLEVAESAARRLRIADAVLRRVVGAHDVADTVMRTLGYIPPTLAEIGNRLPEEALASFNTRPPAFPPNELS